MHIYINNTLFSQNNKTAVVLPLKGNIKHYYLKILVLVGHL